MVDLMKVSTHEETRCRDILQGLAPATSRTHGQASPRGISPNATYNDIWGHSPSQ